MGQMSMNELLDRIEDVIKRLDRIKREVQKTNKK